MLCQTAVEKEQIFDSKKIRQCKVIRMSCNIDEIRVSEETERPNLPNLHPEIDIGILNPSGLQWATTMNFSQAKTRKIEGYLKKNLGKASVFPVLLHMVAPLPQNHPKIIMSLLIEILNQNLNTVPIIFWEFHIAFREAIFFINI